MRKLLRITNQICETSLLHTFLFCVCVCVCVLEMSRHLDSLLFLFCFFASSILRNTNSAIAAQT